MKVIDWSPRRRIELNYQTSLQKLVHRLLHANLPLDDPAALALRLGELGQAGWFAKFADAAASQMITGLSVQQARTWREAARESMRGRELYRALHAEMSGPVGFRIATLVSQNAWLIKSLPQSLAAEANFHVAAEVRKGRRSEEIAADLREWFPEMARSKASLLARTETSKASTALTRARAEDLDLNWYVWRSSEDGRVRASHRLMAARGGCLIRWDDSPEPEALMHIKSTLGHYHAGECPNCRCYPESLLRLDQIRWPHPVYSGGSIRMLTRATFARMAGAEVAA